MMRVLFAVLALLWPLAAYAHESRPAYLELVEQRPAEWRVVWKQPVMGDQAVRLEPRLSNGWLSAKPLAEELTASHFIRRWLVRAPAADLAGATISIGGIEHTITDVVVHIRTFDGRGDSRGGDTMLRAGDPSLKVDFGGWQGLAVRAYLRLGVAHILTGADHLLFVFGLVLLVGFNWRLVGTITAFTLAHSLTLAASTLGFVDAPTTTIEALVALSILFVARELAVGANGGLAARKPWLIAFAFGLLHGFAFAGALAETGLPRENIPLALLLFNLGVEVGQLMFVAALLAAYLAWRRLPQLQSASPFARRLAPYAMGCYAGLLFVERTAAAFA